jgi:hypothetical protein
MKSETKANGHNLGETSQSNNRKNGVEELSLFVKNLFVK